jgi:hypothetical protein
MLVIEAASPELGGFWAQLSAVKVLDIVTILLVLVVCFV